MTEPTSPNSEPSSEQSNAASGTSITLWSPADEKAFAGETIASATIKASSGFKRGRMKIAALALIAGGIGAIGGAVANEGVRALFSPGNDAIAATASFAQDVQQLKDALAQAKTDLATLKASTDQVTKASNSQVGKIGDRLDRIEKAQDRIEKAQTEPNAKIAKLSEALDKLRTQPAPETTASIPEPKPEPKKPPVLQGWTLRDVQSGIALVQGAQGLFDVEPGDPLPGLIKVEAIRRENGRWVVVTNKGWIVAR